MSSLDEAATTKRKASPPPTLDDDDVTRKRARQGDEDYSQERERGRDRSHSNATERPGTAGSSQAKATGAHVDSRRPDDRGRESVTGPDLGPGSSQAPARKAVTQEERKRGQRLFGALNNALRDASSGSQQKRRGDNERLRQERQQRHKAEEAKRREAKIVKLREVRKAEQAKFYEKVMHQRHLNQISLAHSLQTRSKPVLYYRPWELTHEQEDIIDDQVREAEETADKERLQMGLPKLERRRKASPPPSLKQSESGQQSEPTGDKDHSMTSQSPSPAPNNNRKTQGKQPETATADAIPTVPAGKDDDTSNSGNHRPHNAASSSDPLVGASVPSGPAPGDGRSGDDQDAAGDAKKTKPVPDAAAPAVKDPHDDAGEIKDYEEDMVLY